MSKNRPPKSKLERSYLAMQLCISFICAGQAFASYNALFLKTKGLSLLDLGVIGAVSTFSMVLLRVPSGWLPDRVGTLKPFLSSALGMMSILYVFYPVISGFEPYLFMNLLISVANLFIMGPTYQALLMETIGTVEAGNKIGRYRIWGSVSWILLQPVAGILASRLSLDVLFPVSGAFYAMAATATYFVYEPSRKGRRDAVKIVGELRLIRKYVVQRNLIVLLVTQAIAGVVGLRVGFLYIGFLDIYLREIGASLDLIGLIKGLVVIPEIPSLLFFPRLSDKIGRWPVMALGLFVGSAVLLTFGITSNIWVLFAAQLASKFIFGMSMVATIYISELAPANYRASVFAIVEVVTDLSRTPGEYISGYIGENYGLSMMYLFQGTFALVPATFFTAANALTTRRPR
ncbi:MAG: MFS transporter [Candidatus Bathyarchaeota archaeon]|nr:MFS transporter [Candidatus Bathyarchaeota archaeon]MDH5687668.1 MFS transporter [Candidatus Bathyarchaeota archaeon]